jgi:anti-sigma factor RsiW
MFFSNRKKQRSLSAYLDGELTRTQSIDFSEQLAFNADLRSQLADFAATDSLVRNALTPPRIPNPPVVSTTRDEAVRVNPPSRRCLKPAALAAAGLLVTAGITLASLRRRGIV